MINHLTDDQINEILDGRAESRHFDDCTDCRARLDDLRTVFTALESLPEAKLLHNLTDSILARLPQRGISPAWKWLFAAQTIGAITITAWLASSFQLPAAILVYQPPTFDSLIAQVVLFLSTIPLEVLSFTIPTINLELSTFNLTLLIASAAALWVVGNGLLLRGATSRSKK
jgi:hypothetical protein